ncbi:MAG: response regulator [Proteobacteria bacterium]|nr:MAG: response regulator [Pseudomonadota bacterium]
MSEHDLEKKALSGDVESQCSLALLHELGLDRPQDYEKAAYFLQMAVRAGSQLAFDKIKAYCDSGKISPAWLDDLHLPQILPTTARFTLPAPPPKLLLLEDEEDLREMLCETLQMAGYEVTTAGDGEEGLQKLETLEGVALIVTDLKMPKMNGLQFMAAVKKLQLAKEPPLVVMTAFSQQKVIDEGKKLGVSAWIVKPVKRDMLLSTLSRVLSNKASA